MIRFDSAGKRTPTGNIRVTEIPSRSAFSSDAPHTPKTKHTQEKPGGHATKSWRATRRHIITSEQSANQKASEANATIHLGCSTRSRLQREREIRFLCFRRLPSKHRLPHMGNQASAEGGGGGGAATTLQGGGGQQESSSRTAASTGGGGIVFGNGALAHHHLRNLLRPATGSLGLSKAELDKRCKPSGYVCCCINSFSAFPP